MTINITNVAGRTKLAVLQTGSWRATRLHKTETRAENARHNTDAAKVLVRLTDSEAYRKIGKLDAAAYAEHKRLTLPTVQDGMRLLPAGRELEHSASMAKLADERARLVKDFLADYDAEKASAPYRLGTLYDASMWPSHDEVERRFTFSTRYLATPTDGAWADWLAESSRAAEDELRDRLREALERVRDRCRADGKLFSSVFDSIRELADLVPDLDFGGQYAPVVEALKPLTKLHADVLRDDDKGREQAAKKAASILSVLGGIS